MTFFLLRPRAILGLLLILLGAAAACTSTKEPDHVHVLTWQGAVNPVMERYIDRGIDAAERARARAVVLQLDTPGGLDSAMRGIIKRIQASQVPVIVYVSPAGGRAASAGTFITMAGHVAAMAPGTTIGAATPINASGEDIEGALGRKVINDAVAYIRSIAAQRNRNADWAEDAVRDARVATEVEAVELNVIDFGAQNLTNLLAQAHGLEVTVQTESGAAASATLRTANAPVLTNNPTFFELVLYQLANPNIAFLLISLGGLAIVAEIYFQTGVTGIFGVIALILAYFSLGTLPTNWAGVGLISFGFVLLAAEIFFAGAGFGVLGIGGVISLALGGLILTSGSEASLQVSRWLVFGLAATVGAVLMLLVGSIVRMRRQPPHSGRESLVGAKGAARSRLDPRGVVWVEGERWDATAVDPPIEDDTPVIVTGSEGLHLMVRRDPASIKLLPAAEASRDSP